MPQRPPRTWKQTIFTALAHVEHALRGGAPATQADLRQIRNFLVLQYEAPLGSIVHATPMFEALKRAVPDAHVTVAASSMAASVLGHNPYIDRCVITSNPFNNFSKTAGEVREILDSMPPGERSILTTIGNQRTRIALAGLLAGKAVRAGYTLAPDIYDVPLNFNPERGQIEGNLDILRSLGHDVRFCEPRIFFTPEDATHAYKLLEVIAGNLNAPRIAFVTQNSGGQRNQWSQDRFTQVISELSRTRGAIPVFLGTSVDATAIESLRQSLPNQGVSVAGKTTIPQLSAVLAQCDLVVSLDTGTFHVARAVGLPGVVIAPAWQSPLEWLPVDHPSYHVLRGASISAPHPEYWIEEVSAEQVTD